MSRPSGWLSPSVRGGLQLAIQITLGVALFAVVQLLAFRHNKRWDLTPQQSFVLSPQSRKIAEALAQPARITAFYSSQEPGQRREMLDLLEQFKTAAPSLDYRLVDLDRSPGLATKYGVASYNSGVFESGDETTPLRGIDEDEIARAMLIASRARARTLCFIGGHGERTPQSNDDRSGYSEVAKSLEKENFRITTLATVPPEGVPESCTTVILAGPSHDLLPGEADALDTYLRAGGRVLLLVDPDAPPTVLDFLHRSGVEAGNNLIVDQGNRFIGADSFMPHVVRFRTETFRNGLNAPAVLSLARTIRPSSEVPSDLEVLSIAVTSPDSWAFVNGSADAELQFRQGIDEAGPLSIAVLVTYPQVKDKAAPAGQADAAVNVEGRMIVIGDSDFATNFFLNLLGNKDFFMSTVAVLAEDPVLMAARRKGMPRGTISPIYLTDRQGRILFWTSVVAEPAFFLAVGAVIALARRRQRGGR
jgi:ABC-type uncharacterized transport system involved in gliding motility auxiliary subunit